MVNLQKIFGIWIFLTIIIGIESVKQQNRWNSITVETADQISQLNTWNSITVKTVITDTTVITAITCNSRADTTAITWNGITVKQPKQIKQDNSKSPGTVSQSSSQNRLNRTTA